MASNQPEPIEEIDTDLIGSPRKSLDDEAQAMLSGVPITSVLDPNDVPTRYLINDDPDLRLRIGRYLAVIRRTKQISQDAAAKQANLTRPHMSNVELGRARAGWSRLARIAAIYGVTIEAIAEEAREYNFAGGLVSETAAERAVGLAASAEQHNKWLLDNGLGFVLQLNEKEKGVFQMFVGALDRQNRDEVCECIFHRAMGEKVTIQREKPKQT